MLQRINQSRQRAKIEGNVVHRRAVIHYRGRSRSKTEFHASEEARRSSPFRVLSPFKCPGLLTRNARGIQAWESSTGVQLSKPVFGLRKSPCGRQRICGVLGLFTWPSASVPEVDVAARRDKSWSWLMITRPSRAPCRWLIGWARLGLELVITYICFGKCNPSGKKSNEDYFRLRFC